MPLTAEQKKLHFDLGNIGLRAQATAAGLVQLCRELQRAGVLEDAALGRIKSAIADEITFAAPRSVRADDHRRYVCQRLDALFSGSSRVGAAVDLTVPSDSAG